MFSTVSTQKDLIDQLYEIICMFPAGTAFVPCGDKKNPFEQRWQDGHCTKEWFQINERFISMKTRALGLLLGVNRYVCIDADGQTTFRLWDEILTKTLGHPNALPETLKIARNSWERKALIFALPEGMDDLPHGLLMSPEGEKLEFRTGDHQQIIAGYHPETGAPYLSNNAQIVALPMPLYEWWSENIKASSEKSKEKNKKEKVQFDDEITQIIGFVEENKIKKVEIQELEVYLPLFLSRKNRLAWMNGIDDGGSEIEDCIYAGRNRTGFELACELIGLTNWFDENKEELEKKYNVKLKISQSSEDLYARFVNKCNPPIGTDTPGEDITIWNSAESDYRNTSMDDEIILSRLGFLEEALLPEEKKIESIEKIKKELNLPYNESKIIEKKRKEFESIAEENSKAFIIDYISKNKITLGDAPLIAQQLARDVFGLPASASFLEIMLIDALNKKLGIKSGDIEVTQVKNILEISKVIFDSDKFTEGLPLGKEVLSDIRANQLPEEVAAASWVVATSGIMGSNLNFHWNTDGVATPRLALMINGDPATNKSRIIKRFINPLDDLQEMSNKNNAAQLKRYEEALDDYRSMKIEDLREHFKQWLVDTLSKLRYSDEQIKLLSKRSILELMIEQPVLKPRYTIGKATLEGIAKASGDSLDFHSLICPGEMAELMKKMNSKKPMEASSSLIDIWDGANAEILTAGKQIDYIPSRFRSSILSTIQKDRFHKYFDKSDENGFSSRLLVMNVPYSSIVTGMPTEDVTMFPDKFKAFVLDFQDWQLKNCYDELLEVQGDGKPDLLVRQPIKIEQTKESFELTREFIQNKANKLGELYHNLDLKEKCSWIRRLPHNMANQAVVIHLMMCYQLSKEGKAFDVSKMMPEAIEKSIMLCEEYQRHYEIANGEFTDEENGSVSDNDVNQMCQILTKLSAIASKNGSDSVNIDEIKTHSFISTKVWVLEKYKEIRNKKDEKRSRLSVPEILNMMKDFASKGLGDFNPETRVFTPNKELFVK